MDTWNNFFFQNSAVHYLFFYLFIFLHFLFNFVCVFVNKFWKFLFFFILWIKDFNKGFWKIMEHYSKKYRHLKSKILHKFHYLLFVFFICFFSILTSFFPISPNQTCQTIINIFVELYYKDYRFYQRILENSWILIKKNRDIVNTKHFQNSIVYY